jgi:glycosyltransferase involved in cell wall biosynthesis
MNTVVMIAYFFPPEGSAGSYRPLRFVRHLPRVGWKAKVISAVPSQYERYDPKLLEMIPRETEVIRVKGYDLWQAFQSWRSRRIQKKQSTNPEEGLRAEPNGQSWNPLSWAREVVRTGEAWWYYPDMASPWISSAVEATVNLCKREATRVIWATAGPVSSFHVAQLASQRTGKPYVLDFRDSWTIAYNEFETRRPKWAIRSERRHMFKLLEGAQAVIFRFASEAECYWRAYRGALDSLKVHIIPNGYEGSIEQGVIPTGDRCRLVYSGMLRSYQYDTLLESLKLLKATDPIRAKQLHILFVGETPGCLGEQLKELALDDIVELRQPTSQSEIVLLHRDAHGLLVLGRPSEMRGHELLVGAKLFDYLKARRPIIGVLPSDETKNILEKLQVRTIADVNSRSGIVTLLRQVLDAWATNTLSVLVPAQKLCERYSAEVQSVALTRALEGKPSLELFIPGSVKIPSSLENYIEKEDWFH